MDDLINRQAAIDAISEYGSVWMEYSRGMTKDEIAQRALKSAKATMMRIVKQLPSAQPEIIRCKDCKHWTQSTGKMTGYGLGRCDFHDADLVACNGFCYWAERRTDEAD